MSEEKKPYRAQIFRYFRYESWNNNLARKRNANSVFDSDYNLKELHEVHGLLRAIKVTAFRLVQLEYKKN